MITHRFRGYPSRKQSLRLDEWQHALRGLSNAATEQRMLRLRRKSGPWPTYNRQAAELTELRRECEWHRDVPTDFSQSLLRVVDSGWQDFFAKRKGIPHFKAKGRDWATMRISAPKRFRVARKRVKLPKLGWLKIRAHHPIVGIPKVISLTKDCDHWYVSITCEVTEPEPKHPHADKAIGLDMGIAVAVADSDGGFVENPRHLEHSRVRLARAQRRLSRKRKGSNRRERAKARVARVHLKIRNQRKDWQHKLTNAYTNSHGVIVVEALKVQNMMRSAKGTARNPGRNVKAKSGLNYSISDVGWGEIYRQLGYKSAWRGGVLLKVNPRNTSRMCRKCGHTSAENRRTQALFVCVECGHSEHADTHASKNILARARTSAETAGDARGGIRISDPVKRERVLHNAIPESSVL
jgi:putative transposase